MGAGRYLQSVGGVRQLIWRATTAKQSRPWEERCDTEAHVLIPRLYEAGWRILDAFNATVLLKPPALDCFYDANHIHRSRHR